jgi:hypothetical protein
MPTKRLDKKCQQLENFYYIFKNFLLNKRENKDTVIVDFCSGGGWFSSLKFSILTFNIQKKKKTQDTWEYFLRIFIQILQ